MTEIPHKKDKTSPFAGKQYLVSPPFVTCPKCKRDSYGVLLALADRIVRHCNACGNRAELRLPRLKKTLLYLDQLALSNMFANKAPQTPSKKRDADFWFMLRKRIGHLYNLQLLVCPSSNVHTQESNLIDSPERYHALKSASQHFAGGVSFNSIDFIRTEQIVAHVRLWHRGQARTPITLDAKFALNGHIDGWTDSVSFLLILDLGQRIGAKV